MEIGEAEHGGKVMGRKVKSGQRRARWVTLVLLLCPYLRWGATTGLDPPLMFPHPPLKLVEVTRGEAQS